MTVSGRPRRFTVLATAQAPEVAARRVLAACALTSPAAADELGTLVRQAVTNTVRYAGLAEQTPIVVRVSAPEERPVRVEVCHEGGERFRRAPSAAEELGSGRELQVLEHLSEDWGVEYDGTTLIWFTYEPSDAPPAVVHGARLSVDGGPQLEALFAEWPAEERRHAGHVVRALREAPGAGPLRVDREHDTLHVHDPQNGTTVVLRVPPGR